MAAPKKNRADEDYPRRPLLDGDGYREKIAQGRQQNSSNRRRIVPCVDGMLPCALGRNKTLFRRFDRVGNTKFLVRLGNLRLGLRKRHGFGGIEGLSFSHPATRSR